MIFILFGLTTAALVALLLGVISPRLVPVPPPATRGLVVLFYGSSVFAGGLMLAALTRDLWLPPRPAVAVPLPSLSQPEAPPPVALPAPDPIPNPVPAPAADPAPEVSSPPPLPPPDPGPPPEGPTRFGPQPLGQSAAHLRQTLTGQGVIEGWEDQRGPLGQAVLIGRGSGLALLAEAEEDRLYRVQVTTDLGAALADLGPVARDTARLQLGLTALALAPISPDAAALQQESEAAWQILSDRLLAAPDRQRLSETRTVAGAVLRLTLTQTGKASAQLAARDADLDPLLDAEP